MGQIPKIIHYCWLGDEPLPDLVQRCIESWKEVLPDYEIRCWNNDNFDVNICAYTKEAFEKKKYAFVSDYIRHYAVYHCGGIYLDADVEVVRRFDNLLDSKAFTSFENSYALASWIFGSEKGNPLFKEFMDYYADRHFIMDSGEMDLTPNPIMMTDICMSHGLKLDGSYQELDNITIYPKEYFCPYDHITKKLDMTDNTYTIHYFNGTWLSDEQKRKLQKRQQISTRWGKSAGYIYYGFQVIADKGLGEFLNELGHFLKIY